MCSLELCILEWAKWLRALESNFHYLCYSRPEFGYPLNLSIWAKYQALLYYWLLNSTVHWFNWRILIKNWCDNLPYCPQSAHKASTDVRLQSYSHSYSTAVDLVLGKIAAHAFRDNTNSSKQTQRSFLLWGRAGNWCCEPYSLLTKIFISVWKRFLIQTSPTRTEIGTP